MDSLATCIEPEDPIPFEWHPEKKIRRKAGEITDLELHWERVSRALQTADRRASEPLMSGSSTSVPYAQVEPQPWYMKVVLLLYIIVGLLIVLNIRVASSEAWI